MAVSRRVSTGFLFQRRIQKLSNGAKIDWNDKAIVDKIDEAIAKVNKRGARRVVRKARSILKQRAYETGDLYRTVKAVPSKYQYSGSIKLHGRVYTEWLIIAGGDRADYAFHVEAGRYYQETGKKVPAVPFMRSAAASTRKWLRPRMISAIRKALR